MLPADEGGMLLESTAGGWVLPKRGGKGLKLPSSYRTLVNLSVCTLPLHSREVTGVLACYSRPACSV